jgi:hypothetical protein
MLAVVLVASIHGGEGRFQALSFSHGLQLKIVLHAKTLHFAGHEILCKSRHSLPQYVHHSTPKGTEVINRCVSFSAAVESMSTAIRWRRLLFFDFWLRLWEKISSE